MKYKQDKVTWDEFVVELKHELSTNTDSQKAIEMLSNEVKTRDITLLCYERDDNPQCHRYVVKDMIERQQQQKQHKEKES